MVSQLDSYRAGDEPGQTAPLPGTDSQSFQYTPWPVAFNGVSPKPRFDVYTAVPSTFCVPVL